tara:strand:+ start:79 stop:429 length:351 start_codon:yes stop_codon:yes gene_type:complete
MKYIKEGPFLNHKGEQVILPTTEPIDCTVGWLLNFLLKQYRPTPQLTLMQADIRLYNRALDTFERGPTDGYYTFEDADFVVIQRVANAVAPTILLPQIATASPELQDLLDAIKEAA